MNYQRTKTGSKRATKIIIAVAVVLVLLRLIVPHAFSAFFVDAFSPLFRLPGYLGRSGAPEAQIVFSSDSAFASSTEAELLQENIDLKDMLGRPTAPGAIVAAVISKPPFEAYDTIIADAGSDQGIAAGDKVYALADPVVYSTANDVPPSATSTASSSLSLASSTSATASLSSSKSAGKTSSAVTAQNLANANDGAEASTSENASGTASSVPADPQIEIPIGQVVEVYSGTSEIVLYSAPGQKYTVQIGAYHIAASAVSQGAGMFEAMVPGNSNIQVGDPVIIPGIQTGVFASVVSVVTDPARPYSSVIFQSPVDPFSLYLVEIEKNEQSK